MADPDEPWRDMFEVGSAAAERQARGRRAPSWSCATTISPSPLGTLLAHHWRVRGRLRLTTLLSIYPPPAAPGDPAVGADDALHDTRRTTHDAHTS